MTVVRDLASAAEAQAVAAALAAAPADLPPFAPELVEAAASLGHRLLRDAACRAHPELTVLGFWLRRPALEGLRDRFAARTPAEAVRVPAGLVLHVPPANVDTIFVYAWVLSLLAGNRNLVRLSARRTPAGEALVAAVAATLEAHPGLAAGTALVRTPHDDAITGALAEAADLRLIWGGDAAVAHLRRLPRPPHGREMLFPDRWSAAAVGAAAYLAAAPAERDGVARRLGNDVLWFDQAACSSPRLLAWVGEAAPVAAAAADLEERLAALPPSPLPPLEQAARQSARLAFMQDLALAVPLARPRLRGPLLLVDVDPAQGLPRVHCGRGLLLTLRLERLADLAPLAERRDQTLGHWGLAAEDLHALVRRLNGRGFDRLVPLGEALGFDALWDGQDLLAGLTRLVVVRTRPELPL